jgi:hypothetical protein
MKDIMIDIETLDTSVDAAMVQIAAVSFNRKTGEIIESFHRCLDVSRVKENGFIINNNTLDWWKKTNPAVLVEIITKGIGNDPMEVMEDFYNFVGKDSLIWSHSTFDFPIVNNYLNSFIKKRLPFRNARDIRTLVCLSGIDLNDYDWDNKTHDALDDCKFQIKYCTDAFNKLSTITKNTND